MTSEENGTPRETTAAESVRGRQEGSDRAPDTPDTPGADRSDPSQVDSARPAEPTHPPSSGDGFEHRHPDALKLEMALGGAVVGGLTLAGLAIATILVGFADRPPALFLPALALPLLLVFPFLVLPRWRHRAYTYRADERGLEIRHGIWWRSHRIIPRSRLQHTDVAQGPLERQFGLANLIVHTAGTHEAQTRVAGLSLARARELRDRLATEEDSGDDGV